MTKDTTPSASVQPEVMVAVERAAQIADNLASIAARGKCHPHPLPTDTNDAWRRVEDACRDIADAIRALSSSPQGEDTAPVREVANTKFSHPDRCYVEACRDSLDIEGWQPNRHIWADLCEVALRLTTPKPQAEGAGEVERIAVDQNDAMRQELAHIGNLISDLARAMRIDLADDDGQWPDLAGRIGKLHAAALQSPQHAAITAWNTRASQEPVQRAEEVEAALRAFVEQASVGKPGSCVTRSKYVSAPAAVYHRACAALLGSREGQETGR